MSLQTFAPLQVGCLQFSCFIRGGCLCLDNFDVLPSACVLMLGGLFMCPERVKVPLLLFGVRIDDQVKAAV